MKTKSNCKTCGKEIWKWLSQRRTGEGKYCSRACYIKSMKGVDLFAGKTRAKKPRIRVTINCKNCHKEFESVPSKIGVRKYCSRECYLEHHKSFLINIKQLRDNPRYKKWRLEVYQRDGFTCQNCKQVGKDLRAHHIIPVAVEIGRIYDVDNGITLCNDCHKRIHKNYKPKRKRGELLENLFETISSQALQECNEGSETNAYAPDRSMKRHERLALSSERLSDDIVRACR